MAKALIGTTVSPRTVQLLDEIRALRQRVEMLETALAEAEAAKQAVLDDDPKLVVELDEVAVSG